MLTPSAVFVCFSESEDSPDVSQLQGQHRQQGSRGLDEEDRVDECEEDSSSLDDSDVEDVTEEEEEEEEEEDGHQTQRVITFSHTKVQDDVIHLFFSSPFRDFNAMHCVFAVT